MTYVSNEQLDDLRVTHSTIFHDVLKSTESWYKEVCTVVGSDSEENIYDWIEDSIVMLPWLGESDIRIIRENAQRVTNVLHRAVAKLNRRKIKTDNLGIFQAVALPMLAAAAEKAPDQRIADILLSNAQGAKGLHFSTANGNTTNLALNAANWETVRAAMRSRVNPRTGRPVSVGNSFELWVSPTNEGPADRILTAEFGAVPGDSTGVSGQNVNKGKAKVRVIEELGLNANRWVVVAVGLPLKAFVFQELESTQLTIVDQPEAPSVLNDNMNLYVASRDFAVAPTLPELMYMSDPDGAMGA